MVMYKIDRGGGRGEGGAGGGGGGGGSKNRSLGQTLIEVSTLQ